MEWKFLLGIFIYSLLLYSYNALLCYALLCANRKEKRIYVKNDSVFVIIYVRYYMSKGNWKPCKWTINLMMMLFYYYVCMSFIYIGFFAFFCLHHLILTFHIHIQIRINQTNIVACLLAIFCSFKIRNWFQFNLFLG